MEATHHFDTLIIGGSYSGLAAGMALGRALKQVLIIDSGKPCNAPTPFSHNFLTQDGNTPKGIATLGKQQLEKYPNIHFFNGTALSATQTATGFEIVMESGERFHAPKIIFATGIQDSMPDIKGFTDCWGKSVLHCPYCHGYEVRDTKTGILGHGEMAFEFAKMISNWTSDLTLYTNGKASFTAEQRAQLERHKVGIVETEISQLHHLEGQLHHIEFTNDTWVPLTVLYAPRPFVQHCSLPESLGCEMTEEGYISVNAFQETSVPGIYACGDNSNRMRTVANAVGTGTTAGMAASKKLILERF